MPRVLNNLDLTQKQIINVLLHVVSTLPGSPLAGQVVTHNGVFKWYNGSAWVSANDPAEFLSKVLGGGGIVTSDSGGNRYVAVDPDNVTIELSSGLNDGKVRIKAGGVDSAQLKDGSVTTIKITDKNITFAKINDIPTMTVIGRVSAGTGPSSAITVLTDMTGADNTKLITSGAVKAYVDGLVAGIGKLQGSVDASATNTFPVSGEQGGTKKGDYWYITVAGSLQGVAYNAGDVIIANVDGASSTNANHWISLETNRDQASTTVLGLVRLATQAEARAMTDTQRALTPSNLGDVKATDAETQTGTANDRFLTPANLSSRTATETRTGIAEIATEAEAIAATDDTRIMTPLKVKSYFDSRVGGYAANIGNGVATQFTVTHSLNTLDVVAEVFQNSNGESVITDVSRSSANAVIVAFAVAPSSNQFRIVIKK